MALQVLKQIAQMMRPKLVVGNMNTGQIFEGVNVLDFTWAAAGPIATKQFSDNGATVIKIKSMGHPDSIKLGGPFKDGQYGINRSGFFADFNSSKLSVSVDINHPRAKEVVLPLVKWADIVADSFRPGVLEQRGFGYEKLRQINARVIVFSCSLYGANGPWSAHPGFGLQGQAVSGFHALTGWPDRAPAVPKGAYTGLGRASLRCSSARSSANSSGAHR